jgi:hypothetical protein
MFSILFCYIESPLYQKEYKPIFSNYLSEALKKTKIYDSNTDKKRNKNYNSQVNLLVEYLYEESARFILPLENEYYTIFNTYKEILFESNLKENLTIIKNTNSNIVKDSINKYINFIKSYD